MKTHKMLDCDVPAPTNCVQAAHARAKRDPSLKAGVWTLGICKPLVEHPYAMRAVIAGSGDLYAAIEVYDDKYGGFADYIEYTGIDLAIEAFEIEPPTAALFLWSGCLNGYSAVDREGNHESDTWLTGVSRELTQAEWGRAMRGEQIYIELTCAFSYATPATTCINSEVRL